MKAFLAWAIVSLLAGFGAVQCVLHESQPSPEQLIEQQPSGAGPEVEKRPGYFRRVP